MEPIAIAKTPTTITASVKAISSSHTNKNKKKKKHKHKHYMPKGNMGKWFKSKKALKKHVDKVMKKYARQLDKGEITGTNMSGIVLMDMKLGHATAVSGQATSNTTRSDTPRR